MRRTLVACFSSPLFRSVTTMSPPLTIATHDGKFHADEALACFMLKLLPEYQSAQIVRTRDKSLIDRADIVVDVGAVYDPNSKRFDHHQATFKETMSGLKPGKDWHPIRLSSAGLVFFHFGNRVISQLLQVDANEPVVDVLFDRLYEGLIREIDAIDNGIPIAEKQVYEIHTDLSSRVSHLMPQWDEESSDEILNQRFHQAMQLVGQEFTDRVMNLGKHWWPARSLVKDAILKRHEIHESGEIVDLTQNDSGGHFPWKEHLFQLEEELSISGQIKFVIFTDEKGNWRVQGVPLTPHSFELRVGLKPEWRGLRDGELKSKSGLPDCIFVHATGFIGGAISRDSALKMAHMSLTA